MKLQFVSLYCQKCPPDFENKSTNIGTGRRGHSSVANRIFSPENSFFFLPDTVDGRGNVRESRTIYEKQLAVKKNKTKTTVRDGLAQPTV